ncbi:MAG: hypothetical protein AAF564_15745 [Bacteroidota bacterium]
MFEYFLQQELEVWFAHIANELSPVYVGLIETLGFDHDLDKAQNSLIYGREMAFSRNYPCLLKDAGFEIVHQSEQFGAKEHGRGRWIRVLAKI